MSSETGFLALHLEGPMQSWGYNSYFNRRSTGLMPTKSAIAGMCCAAFGYTRGSIEEKTFLIQFASLGMLAISIPRTIVWTYKGETKSHKIEVSRLRDYHTVQNTRRAEGRTINQDCVLTHRYYINNGIFGVILSGDKTFLERIEIALRDPVWGLWLGRKTCIPSAPILAGTKKQLGGVKEKKEDALVLLIGETPLEKYDYQEEVASFLEGSDSLPDNPVSFDSDNRQFSPRRIRYHGAVK